MVRGIPNIETFLQVIGEGYHDYRVLITSIQASTRRESTEVISRELFDSCVERGYLCECAPLQKTG